MMNAKWILKAQNVVFTRRLSDKALFVANEYECSICGNRTSDVTGLSSICPWCGSEMEETDEAD